MEKKYKYKKYKREGGPAKAFMAIYSIGMWFAGSVLLVASLKGTNFNLALAISVLVLSVIVSNIRY